MSDNLLIKNGRVIDPANGLDMVGDVLLVGGKVARVEGRTGDTGAPDSQSPAPKTIDASGLVVCPGLIDIHVHLREPGNEGAETIATGSAAAVAGGFTSIACMPNTTPALDDETAIE
ncbi:MAG: amidohydrolase family protein, partial [Planctomycetes bacterium]|nr:amidohydrolase family protein [Planctomycetota bacterium]